MSRSTPHTPQPHGAPASTGADPTLLVDLVAGDPPVPITVWRTARSGDDPTITIPARLAYRLVAAYSRPGEAVVDLTDDHALTVACQRGERRHHKAWFTDAASLIIGPATEPQDTPNNEPDDDTVLTTDLQADPDGPEPPDLAAWFGDDLTDPDLPPADPPAAVVPRDASVAGVTSLVVACWPLDSSGEAANRVRLAWLLAACAQLLRPGGCLVLVVGTPLGRPATPEDFRPLVAAASAAGLGYLQHIVAVAAETDGDKFTYFATDEELMSLAASSGQQWAVAHLRVHADCFVFSQINKPAPPRRRGGDAHA